MHKIQHLLGKRSVNTYHLSDALAGHACVHGQTLQLFLPAPLDTVLFVTSVFFPFNTPHLWPSDLFLFCYSLLYTKKKF